MKKIYTLLKPVLLGALAVLFVTCGTKSGDYQNLIPQNSMMTISLNAGSIMDKAGLSQAERSAYRGQAEMMLGFLGGMLAADDKEFILSLIDDPDNSGISFKNDIYIFVEAGDMNDPNAGFVAKVSNKKKLDKAIALLTKLSPEVEIRSEKGFDVIVIEESNWNTVAFAYNNNAAMVYRTASDYNTTLKELVSRFEGKDHIGSDKNFSKFLNSKSDFGFMMSYASILQAAGEEAQMIPFLNILSSMYVYMNSEFKKGSIDTDFGILFRDNDAKKEYENLSAQKKVNGKFADIIPDDVLVAFTGYFAGESVYDAITKIPQYAMLALTPQVKTIMSAFEGDMMFAFTGMDLQESEFTGILAATVKDKEILGYILDQANGMMDFTPTEDNAYITYMAGFPISFGMNGDVLYIANDPQAVEALKGKKINTLDKDILKRFKSSYGAGYININRLAGIVLDEMTSQRYYDENAVTALRIVSAMENVVFYADSPYEGKIIVNMVDKSQNAVETFADHIKDLALSGIGSKLF